MNSGSTKAVTPLVMRCTAKRQLPHEVTMPHRPVQGEHALVTGSASNIGRAIALALAREGAAVRCVDVDPVRNETVAAEIDKAGGSGQAV